MMNQINRQIKSEKHTRGRCWYCHSGEYEPGLTNVHLGRGTTVFVLRDVPAEVCWACGEYCLDEDIAEKIQDCFEGAVNSGAEVWVGNSS